jgi:hypothetical protein
MLHQVSLSAALFTFKVDPFRGHADVGETPGQAASRECLEVLIYRAHVVMVTSDVTLFFV